MVAITNIAHAAPQPFPHPGPPARPGSSPGPVGPGPGVAGRTLAAPSGRASNLVVLVVVAVLALGGLGYLVTAQPLAAPGTIGAQDEVYTVADGDTMWTIAQTLAPAGEAGQFVERLVAVNGTSVVEVGQRLAIPAR